MNATSDLDREIIRYIKFCYAAFESGRCLREPAISAQVINEGMRPSAALAILHESPRGEYRFIQGSLRRLSCAGLLEKSIGLVNGKERVCYTPVSKPNRAAWTQHPDNQWLREI